VYRNIALDMNKQSRGKGEVVDDCSLNQRCKEETVRHQVDRRFKSDLLVLQYQAQQLQKGKMQWYPVSRLKCDVAKESRGTK